MNKKISFFTVFWSQNFDERIKNIKFSSEKNKNLVKFLNEKGFDCNITIFDFSEDKKIDHSIHYPFDSNTFFKSKKMNTAIKYLIENENPEFICFFDADVFLSDNQYDGFLNFVNNLNDNHFFVAQKVFDISDNSVFLINFDENKINLNEISHSIREISGLGGFFLIKTSKLYEIGGFDERFVVWGGEDNDLCSRLLRTGMERKYVEFDFYHLPHKKLSENISSNDDYKKQLNILYNDKTNKRPSSLNS